MTSPHYTQTKVEQLQHPDAASLLLDTIGRTLSIRVGRRVLPRLSGRIWYRTGRGVFSMGNKRLQVSPGTNHTQPVDELLDTVK